MAFCRSVGVTQGGRGERRTKSAIRNQVRIEAGGSLLPLWEKARMRVSRALARVLTQQTYPCKPFTGEGEVAPRASAAPPAGRPRSQRRKPTPVSPSMNWGFVALAPRMVSVGQAFRQLCGFPLSRGGSERAGMAGIRREWRGRAREENPPPFTPNRAGRPFRFRASRAAVGGSALRAAPFAARSRWSRRFAGIFPAVPARRLSACPRARGGGAGWALRGAGCLCPGVSAPAAPTVALQG